MTTSSNHSRLSRPVFLVTLFLSFLVQGCTDPVGVRDVIRDRLVTDSDRPDLTVYENGAVLASGRIQRIAKQSFDLAGATFGVSAKTEFLSVGGVQTELSSVAVGQFVEVDGNQLDDGSFEATFVEELDDPADSDDPDDDEEGEEEEEEEESVLICHVPPGNPDNARTKSVDAGSVEAHLAHGDYEGECVEAPSDEVGDDDGGQNDDSGDEDEDEDEDGAKVLVCHIPPGNPDNARTLSVDEDDVTDHLDHGDYEGECGDSPPDGGADDSEGEDTDDEEDEDGAKVLICHMPPGNPDNARTLSVDEDDVADHLEHGDYEGECGDLPPDDGGQSDDGGQQGDDDDGDNDSEKVVICHVPPGNPDKAKTKSVDFEDVQEHLDHGDYLGECLVDDSGGG